jgi:Acyl-protein synthetase, LuxE
MSDDIISDIEALIKHGADQKRNDPKFNELALRLFAYQFEKNKYYKKYCQKKEILPTKIESWEEIPAVPTAVFKEFPMTTFPPEKAVKIFKTTGTSNPSKKGIVYLNEDGLRLLDMGYRESCKTYYFPDNKKLFCVFLMPTPESAPEMGITHGLWESVQEVMDGYIYLITPKGIDFTGVVSVLKQKEKEGVPVFLAGPSFGFVYLFDAGKKQNFSFQMAPGSRLGQGGGYKGRSREMTREEFKKYACSFFGLDPDYVLDTLGLTEISTAFHENSLYNHVKNIKDSSYKPNLPWTRTTAVDPDTLERLPKGKIGLLRHYCLTNVCTVLAVQTDDLGYETENGFDITGRVKGAEARGCSIAMDDMINAATEAKSHGEKAD